MRLQNMKASETTEQIKLFTWARQQAEYIPELALMYHVPNEGKRKQTTGQIMKAQGVKAGVPDLCLPVSRNGFHGMYIEMKFGSNRPTKAQREYMAALQEAGNMAKVAYSAEQAREIIRNYLSRADGFDLVNCEEALKMFGACEGVPEEVFPASPCRKCEFYKENRKKGE